MAPLGLVVDRGDDAVAGGGEGDRHQVGTAGRGDGGEPGDRGGGEPRPGLVLGEVHDGLEYAMRPRSLTRPAPQE